MANQQDIKTAQKVMMASGVARSIFEVDVDRLAAALTLMTPSELERLDAVAHVAGMVRVDANGPVVPEPRQRKPRAALAQLAAKTQSDKEKGSTAHNAMAATVKCLAPGCEFDVDVNEVCRDHKDATPEQKAIWRKLRADAA